MESGTNRYSPLGSVQLIVISEDVNRKAGQGLPVDLIRTFAIFLVMLLHACNQYYTVVVPNGLNSELYWWTATVYKALTLPCVPLFVILSGALLLHPSKLHEPIRFFLKKRFNRIGFAFFFWTIIYLGWALFVSKTPFTSSNIIEGLLYSFTSGAYYHFWFLYLIVGLYLITPILRTIVAYDSQKILRYLIFLWFIYVAVVPLVQFVSVYPLNETVFLIGGSIGYFVLGVYLQKIRRVRSSLLYALFFSSFGVTVFGTWLLRYSQGNEFFFFNYQSVNVILTSVALFLFLLKFPPHWTKKRHPLFGRFVKAVSNNTLPIYMFHVIILETLQNGYLGFTLNITTMNPIIAVPVIAVVTLFVTLGLVLVMKKVPVLRRLIG